MHKQVVSIALVSLLCGCAVPAGESGDETEPTGSAEQAICNPDYNDCNDPGDPIDPDPDPDPGPTPVCTYSWSWDRQCTQQCCTQVSPDQRQCSIQTVSNDSCLWSPPGASYHRRKLYSVQHVVHSPVWFQGATGIDTVNADTYMGAGCTVEMAKAIHYHGGTPQFPDSNTLDHGSHGFVANSASWFADSLEADVRWWHDWWWTIDVQMVYYVREDNGWDCSIPGVTRDTP